MCLLLGGFEIYLREQLLVFMRYPIVFATLAATLVLVTLNETDNRILRGSRTPAQLFNQGDASVQVEVNTPQAPAEKAVVSDGYDNNMGEKTKEPVRLNLKLPDMEWDDYSYGNSDAFPNVFGKQPSESAVHWSGRLHLDESEEAKAKPLNETILGAELELQLKLP
ncbi:MAG: hypothetical protein COW58_04535 [Thalassolituus sp. CG17_big_fil_post_rev_8_21_14_2_50_53_8]|nr:MAG: hypothetical protein COW58_04535 [Thalassolituus sp. CG17_big_fil_post_rev_8_21_14_2_50_53_8]